MELLEQVAKASALREGIEGVAAVLRAIHSSQVLSLKDLSAQTRMPLPVLSALRRELEKRNILERRGSGMALTQKGAGLVRDSLGIGTRHSAVCRECEGRRITISSDVAPALEILERYFEARPGVDTSLDQAPCLPETSLRRALYMYELGALEGKSVLFAGDDDSISLAAGLLGKMLGRDHFCRRMTVVDADQRILDHLSSAAEKEGLVIECVRWDFRDPLPEDLRGAFDVFETDPPYTAEGAGLFLARGASALRDGSGYHAFLSFGAKPPEESWQLHQRIQNLRLAVDEVIPSFNRYAGASILGSSSQIIHMLSTPATASAAGAVQRFTRSIYTGEANPTIRLYSCLRCQQEVRVTRGERFRTIEQLKAKGCPNCGHNKFRYMRRVT